jgi:nicotinamide riboside transporter PnuC
VTGVIGVSLGKLADTILNVPQGCYSAYFWVNDPKAQSTASGSALCANNTDKWTMKISANTVIMLAP